VLKSVSFPFPLSLLIICVIIVERVYEDNDVELTLHRERNSRA